MLVFLTKFTNFSFLSTKSVSQFTSIIVALLKSSATSMLTSPSLANLSAFFAAFPRPFSRRISTALSISPFASCKAFLQSIIAAPVLSRRSFTIAALISITLRPHSSLHLKFHLFHLVKFRHFALHFRHLVRATLCLR